MTSQMPASRTDQLHEPEGGSVVTEHIGVTFPTHTDQADSAAEHALRQAWPHFTGDDPTDCFWEQVARTAVMAATPYVERGERHRLADLLESHRAALSEYVADAPRMLDLVVFLLRLDKP